MTERSSVVCLICDGRFPLAHLPISFLQFFRKNGVPVILLMNKIDLISQVQLEQQTDFLRAYMRFARLTPKVLAYSALELADEARIHFLNQLVREARELTGIKAPNQITIGFLG